MWMTYSSVARTQLRRNIYWKCGDGTAFPQPVAKAPWLKYSQSFAEVCGSHHCTMCSHSERSYAAILQLSHATIALLLHLWRSAQLGGSFEAGGHLADDA